MKTRDGEHKAPTEQRRDGKNRTETKRQETTPSQHTIRKWCSGGRSDTRSHNENKINRKQYSGQEIKGSVNWNTKRRVRTMRNGRGRHPL